MSGVSKADSLCIGNELVRTCMPLKMLDIMIIIFLACD